MRYVFFTLILIQVLGCSPGSNFQTKTYINNPEPLVEKIDLNKIKINCPSQDCPESLALFVTVYRFKTQNPNQKPNTYQAFKTCNASVIKEDNSDNFELFTSGHCSHKEADISTFKNQYAELKNYMYQSRTHYLYIYNKQLDETLPIKLPEPEWNYYNPKKLFSLDIMKFNINHKLFSDLVIARHKVFPETAELFTLRREHGSNYTIKKQNCDIKRRSSDYTYEIANCKIKAGDSGAPLISHGEIYGFISHTNNYSLGGQFVPSLCIASHDCSTP